MMTRYSAVLGAMFAVAFVPACASPTESSDEATESTEQPLTTQEIAVPVGDPFRFISPTVLVNAAVGDTLHFTAGTTCSSCVTWKNPDAGIARYGGVTLGYGTTFTLTPGFVGNSRITLDYCVQTSPRFQRCISTYVYITTT